MPSWFDKIQAKLELYRLEQRYTRNRDRRTTFISNTVYVDGEYVHQSPNTTGSSTQSHNSSSNSSSAMPSPDLSADYSTSSSGARRRSVEMPRSQSYTVEATTTTTATAQRKKLNRFSSMPGFGSLSKSSAAAQDWRVGTMDNRELR